LVYSTTHLFSIETNQFRQYIKTWYYYIWSAAPLNNPLTISCTEHSTRNERSRKDALQQQRRQPVQRKTTPKHMICSIRHVSVKPKITSNVSYGYWAQILKHLVGKKRQILPIFKPPIKVFVSVILLEAYCLYASVWTTFGVLEFSKSVECTKTKGTHFCTIFSILQHDITSQQCMQPEKCC
jgi:hypothetical protein